MIYIYYKVMDEIKQRIIDSYEQRGKTITTKSVDKYIKDITTIRSLLGVEATDNDISFLYNFDDVSAVIEDMRGRKVVDGEKVMASPNTKRNYYQSVVSVFDALGDYKFIGKYQKKVNSYNKQYSKKLDEANTSLTVENENKLISYAELETIVNELTLRVRDVKDKLKVNEPVFTEEDLNAYQTLCLLRLYMAFPARNDFATLLWGTESYLDKKDNNYLILSTQAQQKTSNMVINNYKTSGLYDTRILEFDKKDRLTGLLTQWRIVLRRYMKQFDKDMRIWAGSAVFYSRFLDIDNEKWINSPMTSNKLSKYLARFFEKKINKPLGTTSIAKIVNSHQNKDNADAIKKNSKARGTSVGTLSKVYTPVLPKGQSPDA